MTTPIDQDYPRMMFHRTKPWVIVITEAEEAALGPEWSRIVFSGEGEPEPDPDPEPSPNGEETAVTRPPPDEAAVRLARAIDELKRENQELRRKRAHRRRPPSKT
jgi:hypothetical protein